MRHIFLFSDADGHKDILHKIINSYILVSEASGAIRQGKPIAKLTLTREDEMRIRKCRDCSKSVEFHAFNSVYLPDYTKKCGYKIVCVCAPCQHKYN